MRTGKPIVFVSYAHKDEPEKPGPEGFAWLSFVLEYLNVGKRAGAFDLWVDTQMMGSANWRADIKAKLGVCDIFILLVSARSMASDFILDEELPVIRERDAKGEAVHIYPVLLTPTPILGLDNVRDKNIRPRDAQPLSKFSMEHDRPQKMSDIADEIAKLAGQISAGARPAGGASSTAARLTKVDIGQLPETAYENLVGRDAELERLDAAWTNSEVNILSLVAEGGAGKSALLNEWLTRLRRDNYRGAEVVLGWSFYSQGTHERATSSEQFLDWALRQLGATAKANSASAKGEAIAEAMTKRRVLLALDGVEPLQHGPTSSEPGKLKDDGLRALLRHFAQQPPAGSPGLIVLTSRVEVADIAKWNKGAAPVERIEKLSDAAGAQILADGGVTGSLREREAASREFGGHPLALQLLASYLNETQGGDVRRRDHIRGLLADAENPGQDHARRVMESYEKEWLADKPLLLAILSIVGLFDRPADAGCLAALRAEPAIPGLTDALVGLREDDWSRAVHRLREARLLSPVDPVDPGALDAHPLVREWFGERLRRTKPAAWTAAHSRLYEHLRDATKEGDEPSLAALAPLYHAIAHGCRAGRYQEALDEVYADRICRWGSDDELFYYSSRTLGAHGSNLAAISWFFDKPYDVPVAVLNTSHRAWVLSQASFALVAQGRLREALPAMRASLLIGESLSDRRNVAIRTSNLSEAELLVGEIAAARLTGARSVSLADQAADEFQMMGNRTTHAAAVAAAGERAEAELLLDDAEARQRKRQPGYPSLYSVQGYRYCDLLLTKREFAAARDRAMRTLGPARQQRALLDIALDTTTLGRAHHGLALIQGGREYEGETEQEDYSAAAGFLDQAIDALGTSGDNTHLPRGLLARAAFRRSVGDFPAAARDLDEVEEIAEPGPMRLFLCDLALERARLALARREAFAPLNGLVGAGPAAPAPPDGAESARLLEEARAQLAVARKLVADCGYHKRDEEVAELDAVLSGERRFADLPVHV
jgi:hypothetical protein